MIGGELLGQVLLSPWTGLVSRQLYLDRSVPRWLVVFGALLAIAFPGSAWRGKRMTVH